LISKLLSWSKNCLQFKATNSSLPILSHLNPAHALNIILPSTFKIPVWTFLFTFSNQTFVFNSYIKLVCCLHRTHNPSIFTSKTHQAHKNLRSSSLCNFFRSFIILSLLTFRKFPKHGVKYSQLVTISRITQPIKKFPAIYGVHRFTLCSIKPTTEHRRIRVHNQFPNNTIVSSTTRSLKLFILLDFSFPSFLCIYFYSMHAICGPPLRSSGQGSWLQIQRSRVPFPELPNFFQM
jgi:hypothetical protein